MRMLQAVGIALALGGVILSLSSCSTLKINHSAMEQVKTVTLVGYSTKFMMHNSNSPYGTMHSRMDGGEFFFDFQGISKTLPPDYIARSLVEALTQEMKWNFTDLKKTTDSPVYAEIKKEHNSNFWRTLAGGNERYADVDGMLGAHDGNRLKPEDRKRLMETFKSDAVAVAEVLVELSKRDSLKIGDIGLGAYKPTVTVALSIYDRNSPEQPIWEDKGAAGEAGGKTFQIAGLTDTRRLQEETNEAMKNSLAALIQRYRQHKAESNAAK